jgi:hypothetical protein
VSLLLSESADMAAAMLCLNSESENPLQVAVLHREPRAFRVRGFGTNISDDDWSIEAPCLVHGGHGASLRSRFARWEQVAIHAGALECVERMLVAAEQLESQNAARAVLRELLTRRAIGPQAAQQTVLIAAAGRGTGEVATIVAALLAAAETRDARDSDSVSLLGLMLGAGEFLSLYRELPSPEHKYGYRNSGLTEIYLHF